MVLLDLEVTAHIPMIAARTVRDGADQAVLDQRKSRLPTCSPDSNAV